MGNAAYNIPGDTEMKFIKAGFVSSLALCACLLTGCTQPVPPSAGGPASSSEIAASSAVSAASADASESGMNATPAAPSSSASDGVAGDDAETEADVNGSEESTNTEGLVKYDSVYDIPFIELEIANDGKDLYQNGQPWASTPGTQRFGELCFTDGKTLYIQCFLSENPEDGFRWYWVCFDHWHEDALGFLPEETYNKLFTHADGYTLYTDDGYQYTVTPCQIE